MFSQWEVRIVTERSREEQQGGDRRRLYALGGKGGVKAAGSSAAFPSMSLWKLMPRLEAIAGNNG